MVDPEICLVVLGRWSQPQRYPNLLEMSRSVLQRPSDPVSSIGAFYTHLWVIHCIAH